MEKWKTLSSEYIIKRPWLTARRDRLMMPNGHIHPEYYVLEYPTWVNVIAIDCEGRFVMVEQYRHGLDDIFTELVAGVAEEGETPLEAAKRELEEETGYVGGEWTLNCVLSANPGSQNNLSYSFIARDVEPRGNRHLDDTEDVTLRLLTENEVFALLESDSMKQALMAAPLWKYFFMNRL
ncbi:MAG: NUDIX hydrolase [Pseudoflavonifractor sp.]|nr:NUDIX hydrolase [Alloprevotella sp.]MCM1117255.1 NUDIX hydrolase [Pseudoflavonifractor sp.]